MRTATITIMTVLILLIGCGTARQSKGEQTIDDKIAETAQTDLYEAIRLQFEKDKMDAEIRRDDYRDKLMSWAIIGAIALGAILALNKDPSSAMLSWGCAIGVMVIQAIPESWLLYGGVGLAITLVIISGRTEGGFLDFKKIFKKG